MDKKELIDIIYSNDIISKKIDCYVVFDVDDNRFTRYLNMWEIFSLAWRDECKIDLYNELCYYVDWDGYSWWYWWTYDWDKFKVIKTKKPTTILIWDILDYVESWKSNSLPEFISDNINWIIQLWLEKRKPIEDQSIETIEFIYSLLP